MRNLEFELDNYLASINCGFVYLGGHTCQLWKLNDEANISIGVPLAHQKKFESVWNAAKQLLGNRLRVLNVQYDIPIAKGSNEIRLETVYSISISSARSLIDNFEKIRELAEKKDEVKYNATDRDIGRLYKIRDHQFA